MTLAEAVSLRRSRRKYLPDPVEPEKAEALQALADQYSENSGRIALVFDDPAAFGSLRKTYGLLSGVRNYAGLIARGDDLLAAERLGYYGELLVLHAVAMGLGTCWVGGSFDRASCPFALAEDEQILCTIALGYAKQKNSFREDLIYGITHRKTKSIEQMIDIDAPAPDWFMRGMQAVQKAPSAVNRQPVVFSYKNGSVSAGVPDQGTASLLDFGIAKAHFELGAGRGTWAWGNHGVYNY